MRRRTEWKTITFSFTRAGHYRDISARGCTIKLRRRTSTTSPAARRTSPSSRREESNTVISSVLLHIYIHIYVYPSTCIKIFFCVVGNIFRGWSLWMEPSRRTLQASRFVAIFLPRSSSVSFLHAND